jgi:1-aminocyclopropane-1-carboxylate deaminase
MNELFQLPTPLQKIENDLTRLHKINLFLKRDDLIHPDIPGNKWRKLKYNVEQALQERKDTILTYGGAFSNHITATAAAGKHLGFKTIGVIRGEAYVPLNKSLQFAKDQGMELFYMDRQSYRNKDFHLDLDLTDIYEVPEGGANELGVKGCKEIVSEIDMDFDFICSACGTGTTLAGIAMDLQAHQKAIGFPVLKGGDFLFEEVRKYGAESFELQTAYHFGGYAKTSPELIQFIKDFYREHQIMLDYVYTGKMMYGIFDLISKQYFPENSTLVAVHTGGVVNANVFD